MSQTQTHKLTETKITITQLMETQIYNIAQPYYTVGLEQLAVSALILCVDINFIPLVVLLLF